MILSRLLLCLLTASAFVSCSKELTQKKNEDYTVRIRVENKTGKTATNVTVNGEAYGTVKAGESSSYHCFSKLVYAPSVSFYGDTTQVSFGVGFCGTVTTGPETEPSYMAAGNYVYTITTGTTAYGFAYSFAKE